MLSICIPIYNQNISIILLDLNNQIAKIKVEIEIIFIDDASTNISIKNKNKLIEQNNHQYIILEENIGRSKIRNLFLKYTKYDTLLFIDGDSEIIDDLYLEKAINCINKNDDVISFFRVYPTSSPKKKYQLRWNYGIKSESKIKKNNNSSFMTCNFLIKREVFDKVKFNETILEYGHEDTLFGFDLLKAGIHIKYIYNPILNADLELNTEFIHKTEIGLNTLFKIKNKLKDREFNNSVKILRVYDNLKNKPLIYTILSNSLVLNLSTAVLKKILLLYPKSIYLFNTYKLLYFISIANKKTKNQ